MKIALHSEGLPTGVKMTDYASRGKTAERLIKKKLVSLEAANFCHARWPDRRAGSFVAALADFLVMRSSRLTLLEAKETQHEFRLPYGSFSDEQIARMRMWNMAGAQAHILVYSSSLKVWRAEDVDWFFRNKILKTEAGKPVGSWNLSGLPTITLDEYFRKYV
jgi:hypothetical protein